MLKKIIKKGLSKLGYQLQRKNNKPIITPGSNLYTMMAGLQRCFDRGVRIRTVIDVGASDGRWSKDCMKVFPDANYILVEAQDGHKSALEEFKHAYANVDYVLAAAGSEKGTIYFDAGDLYGGLASESPFEKNGIEVPVVSLDEQIEAMQANGPYLLKLDTHGFEIPILEGAMAIIRNAELIVIETYNFKLTKDSLRYWEMCAFMDNLGFSPIEHVDFMLRDFDKAFWQMDTFFIKSTSTAFNHNGYS